MAETAALSTESRRAVFQEQPIYGDIVSTLSVAQKILEKRGWSAYGHESLEDVSALVAIKQAVIQNEEHCRHSPGIVETWTISAVGQTLADRTPSQTHRTAPGRIVAFEQKAASSVVDILRLFEDTKLRFTEGART